MRNYRALVQVVRSNNMLGRMWRGNRSCVRAIYQPWRSFGTSDHHSGQATALLAQRPKCAKFNRSFPYCSALFRGDLSGAAQHRLAGRHPCLGDFTRWKWVYTFPDLSRSFPPGLRLKASRWTAAFSLNYVLPLHHCRPLTAGAITKMRV